MKKLITIILLSVLLLTLFSCGKDLSTMDLISGLLGDLPNMLTSGDGDISVDVGAILSGDVNVLYPQDEAARQEMIDAGKEQGVDISFAPDGTMTATDKDGNVMTQNPDGTWSIVGEDGNIAQIGGNWPDNAFTKLIPKPDFSITTSNVSENEFTVTFMAVSTDAVRAYVEKVKAAGFTIDAEVVDQNAGGYAIYSYNAHNTNGYYITVGATMSVGTIILTKGE